MANKDRIIEQYQKFVNEVDDLFEYRYAAMSKEDLKDIVYRALDKLADNLKEVVTNTNGGEDERK